MPTGHQDHPLFGRVTFTVAAWTRGAPITFTSGFDPGEVTTVEIPQLRGTPGTNNGRMQFHQRAHGQLLQVFADLEQLNLMSFVHSSAGSFNMRLRKPANVQVSHLPSNHSYGIAIDLNSDELPLGTDDTGNIPGTVRPLKDTFEGLGFRWLNGDGDPMHFEVKTFIDHPKSTIQPATIVRNGVAMNVKAFVIKGHTHVAARDFITALGGVISAVSVPRKELTVINDNGQAVLLKGKMIGNSMFVLLSLASAHFGLGLRWDNATHTATLV